jgi:hypothetical protein
MKRMIFIVVAGMIFSLVGAFGAVVPDTSPLAESVFSESVLLQYKFPEETVRRYSLSVDDWEKMMADGAVRERRQSFTLIFRQEYLPLDEEGVGAWVQTFEEGVYQGVNVKGLVGKKVICRISPTGKIISTEGLQALFNEFVKLMQKSMAFYIPGLDRLPVKIDFTRMPSALFHPLYQPFIPVFPAKPVEMGETWAREEGISRHIAKEARSMYRMEQVEEGVARISLFTEEPKEGSGKKRVFSKGTIFFNIESGELKEMEAYLEADGVNMNPARIAPGMMQASKDITGIKKTKLIVKQILPSSEE